MPRMFRCARLRPIFTAFALLGMSAFSAVHADSIVFNPTGGVTTTGGFNPGNMTITSFNWGSGDALAVNSISGGAILAAGSTFQLYYQTKLIGLNMSSGGNTPAGLNVSNGYQITEIASFTEVVQVVSGNATTFGLAGSQSANSGIKIYFEDLAKAGAGPMANANTGTGYNPTAAAGIQIYSAGFSSNSSNYTDTTKVNPSTNPIQTLNPLTPTNYSGVTTDQGTGSTVLNMNNLVTNSSFFLTPGLVFSQFSSNLRNNFGDIGASLLFNLPNAPIGTAPSLAPSVGANNGTSGTDFLLEISSATQSFAIPEPASLSMAFTALVLVSLATWRVRRRQATV